MLEAMPASEILPRAWEDTGIPSFGRAGEAFGAGEMGMGALHSGLGVLGAIGMAPGGGKATRPVRELATDYASRMARAREMGFGDASLRNVHAARMLDDPEYGQLPHILERNKPREYSWYHGTQAPEDFPAFATGGVKRATKDWNTMLGPHFSDSSGVASEFAEGLYSRKTTGGRVIPVQLNIQNPRVFNVETDLSDDAARWAFENGHLGVSDFKGPGINLSEEIANTGGIPDWAYGFGGQVLEQAGRKRRPIADAYRKHLQDLGHDGIVYGNSVEGVATSAAIPFDPTNIRSPHAMFDPAKRHSADILASVAGAAAGTGIGLAASQRPSDNGMRY
jgi:hypothetical protein